MTIQDMNCIFCKIARKEIPTEIIHEDDHVVVFKDIHPKAPVHLLVISKDHIVSIAHLELGHEELAAKLLYTAKQVAADQGLPGYKLLFNVGPEGGQTIAHLHLHIMGGWSK